MSLMFANELRGKSLKMRSCYYIDSVLGISYNRTMICWESVNSTHKLGNEYIRVTYSAEDQNICLSDDPDEVNLVHW